MMVYFAVMSPLFWAPAFVKTPEHLARLLGLLLICSGINSMVGVLQVYDPDAVDAGGAVARDHQFLARPGRRDLYRSGRAP